MVAYALIGIIVLSITKNLVILVKDSCVNFKKRKEQRKKEKEEELVKKQTISNRLGTITAKGKGNSYRGI